MEYINATVSPWNNTFPGVWEGIFVFLCRCFHYPSEIVKMSSLSSQPVEAASFVMDTLLDQVVTAITTVSGVLSSILQQLSNIYLNPYSASRDN